MRLFFMWCMMLVFCTNVFSRESNAIQSYTAPDTIAPTVFILGEDEALEAYLNRRFPEGIIDAFDGNAQAAFSKWATMLQTMEAYAEKQNFNIKGVKAFATVYWNKNGEIEHLAYSLKAHSAYIKAEKLNAFFNQFIKYYKLPVKTKTRFQHTFTLALPYPSIRKRPAKVVLEN